MNCTTIFWRQSKSLRKLVTNSFLTLEDNSLIQYYCSHYYNPEFERGIRYNDPFFKFEWPESPRHISEKDMSWPDFNI